MNTISNPEEIKKAFTTFAYNNNINMVAQFHNQIFIGINEAVTAYEKLLQDAEEKKEIKDLKYSIHFYENYISDNLRNFTLVMHLSNFEEISALVCKEEGITIANGSSIDRFKKGWEKKLSKSLGLVPAWGIIKNAAKIRNAILHAAGRISLNRDKANIEQIIIKEKLKRHNDRVYVTEQFLNKTKDAIWDMTK